MRNTRKCIGFAVIAAIALTFSLTACDNGTTDTPDPKPTDPQSVSYVSKDGDGNLYTLVITEKTNRSARYAAKKGDSFTFTVELFNSGNYTVALTYSGTVDSVGGSEAAIQLNISVNNKPLTITITGTEMTVINGDIVDDKGKPLNVTDTVTLTPVTDKTALGAAITAANTAKEGVVVSANGTDIATTVYWVTQTQMDSFTSAIATAQAFYNDSDSDQSMVNSARITLVAAINVFNGQKKAGSKTGGAQDSSYDIYVAGSYSNGGISTPCYWKNGVKTDLSFIGYNDGAAERIIIDGGNIYISGWVGGTNEQLGCYWKNGVLTVMDGYATDMAVSNGNVYITGSYRGDYYSFPCYWINGVKNDLPIQEGEYGSASAISVYGSLIYIAGDYAMVGWNYSKICYWRNGVRTDLTSTVPEEGYNIYDIAVSNTGVAFIVGTTSWSYPRTSWYWINSFNNLIVPTGGDSIPFSVALSGDNVYIAGFYDNGNLNSRQTYACYWKNGSLNTLSGGSAGKDSFAYAISIIGDDVFIAGSVNVSFELVGDTMKSESTACYWKNGTLVELSNNGSANGIAVVKKGN